MVNICTQEHCLLKVSQLRSTAWLEVHRIIAKQWIFPKKPAKTFNNAHIIPLLLKMA